MIITPELREKLVAELFDECTAVLSAKGKSYAGRQDMNANFKRIAEICGTSKYQVWQVYFNKHVESINNAIRREPGCPTSCDGESIRGRVIDLINYAVILETMQIEDADEGV